MREGIIRKKIKVAIDRVENSIMISKIDMIDSINKTIGSNIIMIKAEVAITKEMIELNNMEITSMILERKT